MTPYDTFLLERIAYLLTPMVQTFEAHQAQCRREYAAQQPPPAPASPSGVESLGHPTRPLTTTPRRK
jgi:hypothetical protein